MKPLHRRIVQRKIAEAREAKALRKQEEAAQAMLADGVRSQSPAKTEDNKAWRSTEKARRVSGTDSASGFGDRLPDPSAVCDMDSDPVPPGCGDRGHCDY